MNRFRRRVLRRDGLDLVLHVAEGDGPLVFLQHGLCGDWLQPASVFPWESGARLAVLDCRGHGESSARGVEGLSIESFADDVVAAIAVEARGPVVVGGISMGAAIALRIACLQPELVRGLVIARPAWVTDAAPINMEPNMAVGGLLQNEQTEGEVESFLASDLGRRLAARAPDNLASLVSFFARMPRNTTAALLTQISADGPGISLTQLSALPVPTLVIGHGEDEVHPMAHARTLALTIPGARLAEIPPKARGKVLYEAAFRHELAKFLQEIHHEPSRSRLV